MILKEFNNIYFSILNNCFSIVLKGILRKYTKNKAHISSEMFFLFFDATDLRHYAFI